MADPTYFKRFTLETEGYHIEVARRTATVHADGRGYNQRDDRAYQLALHMAIEDLRRVANLLSDAADEAETRFGAAR
jgi:hypothetical protein